MTVATEPTSFDRIRPAMARTVEVLRDRARAHCESSATTNELLANVYRRRAAELDLAAWIGEVKSGAAPQSASRSCVA